MSSLYAAISSLPLTINAVSFELFEQETSSEFTRTTTQITLHGPDHTGTGEDVTYTSEAHYALESAPTEFNLEGTHTIDEFSHLLTTLDLFPDHTPERPVFTNYRRWGFESAALDLALRQASQNLTALFSRPFNPVRFIVSTKLGDPPTRDRVTDWLEIDKSLEFKLDPTPSWTRDLAAALSETNAVRILDFKAHYADAETLSHTTIQLYQQLLTQFPDVIIEDPPDPLIDANHDRISWDAPITGIESIKNAPATPTWLNIKPSRFGSLRSTLQSIEFCRTNGISMYGGGQFELAAGRGQLHVLASLFYPDSPNDIAPKQYNNPTPTATVPPSPLLPPDPVTGFRWPEPQR